MKFNYLDNFVADGFISYKSLILIVYYILYLLKLNLIVSVFKLNRGISYNIY